MKGPKPRPLADRFWPKVQRGDGCWLWMGYRQKSGHGRIGVAGNRVESTSRVAWQLTYGPIPEGMEVCHKCDNPPCVRPDHLFVGTHADNMADCVAKGRHSATDGRHHNARLNADSVREIRRLRAAGVSGKEVATLFGVAETTVSQVFHRHLWPHIKEQETEA